jgi:hypothetical protein
VHLIYAAGTPTGHIGYSKQSCVTARLSLGQLVLGVLEQPLHPEKREHVKMPEASTHHAVVLHAMAASQQYDTERQYLAACAVAIRH